MFVDKLKTMAGILLLLVLIGSGAGTLWFHEATAAEPDDAVPNAAQQGPRPLHQQARGRKRRRRRQLHPHLRAALRPGPLHRHRNRRPVGVAHDPP